MKIALFNSLFPPIGIGGSEMSVYYLAKGLVELGHTVRVFSQSDSNVDSIDSYDGIDILRLGSPAGYEPNIYAQPKLVQEYKRTQSGKAPNLSEGYAQHLKDFSPNIIHTNVIGDLRGIWRLANAHGIGIVHTLRSYSLICHRRMLKGSQPCVRQCRDCALSGARQKARDESSIVNGLVGISEHILNVHLHAGWFSNTKQTATIGNSYQTNSNISSSVTKPYDFGYIGRLHETKGLAQLLESIHQINKNSSQKHRLLIAGTGNAEYVKRLRRLYEGEYIVFSGFVTPDSFFEQIKFCVVPSLWYEPFGRVFIESLHHGVPVIGSKRGGGSEILTHETGWLFEPESNELDSRLKESLDLTEEDYLAMCQQCLKASENYSVQSIARQYETFYEKVLIG
ncbi:MAG: glycosyltransferase [Porticoccaceae bacterium]